MRYHFTQVWMVYINIQNITHAGENNGEKSLTQCC